MTPALWAEVTAMYSTIRALQDDVEDGLWDEVKEAADNYRANVKDAGDDQAAIDAARDGFLEDFNDILADYGYPAITEPTPTTAAP